MWTILDTRMNRLILRELRNIKLASSILNREFSLSRTNSQRFEANEKYDDPKLSPKRTTQESYEKAFLVSQLEDNDSAKERAVNAYKSRWAAKIQEMEKQNPVRLRGRNRQIFKDDR